MLIQKVEIEFPNKIELFVKREDLIDEFVHGNKYYKLKYNLLEAKKLSKKKLITFGGAYSNHLLAVSYAGKKENFETYAFVRGEELASNFEENSILLQAHQNGMKFIFVTRTSYRNKEKLLEDFFKTTNQEGFYVLSEGGTNELAVKGTQEILNSQTEKFDYICCAVGTGGTLAGIIKAKKNHQKVIGFPTLKDVDFLVDEIKKYTTKPFKLNQNYHFGGYAKTNQELKDFIDWFNATTQIKIEPIYTGKMFYGIFQEINKGIFPVKSKILAIYIGGV